MISLKHALADEPRPRYRRGMEHPLPDCDQRLRRRSGASPAALEARLRRWRDSSDLQSPAHWRQLLDPFKRSVERW